MFLLSLAPLIRAARFGFLQSQFGTSKCRSAVRPVSAPQPAQAEVVGARFLQVPEPDRPAMLARAASMLRSARRSNQSLSMLVMHLHDLPELEVVFGSDAAEEAIDEVMTQLTHLAARQGFAMRSGRDTFTLLMPNIQAETLVRAIQAKLGKPCCIDFELDGEEILLVPELMVRTLGPSESAEEAYDTLCKDIAEARQVHSRRPDTELPPSASPQKNTPIFFSPLPPTMPMPMARR